jgi:hypothetical protein
MMLHQVLRPPLNEELGLGFNANDGHRQERLKMRGAALIVGSILISACASVPTHEPVSSGTIADTAGRGLWAALWQGKTQKSRPEAFWTTLSLRVGALEEATDETRID